MTDAELQDVDEQIIDTLQFRSIGKISIGHKHATSQFTSSRLLIISNIYGFCLIGKPDSFLFIPTNQLVRFTLDNKQDTSAFQKVMVPPDGSNGLHTLSLSCDELTVGVVVGSKVMLFDVRGISKGDNKSFKTCSFPETVKECVWSPSNPSLFLATTSSGKLISYDINNDSKQDLIPQNVCTCTWDQKGNNILVGYEDATVSVLSYPSTNKVLTIPKPENDPPFVKAKYVQYAKNDSILVGYSYGEDAVPLVFHVVSKPPPKKFQLFQMPGDDPIENTFYTFPIPEWNVVVVGASNSSEIELLGTGPKDSDWKKFCLDDDARPQLPLTESDDYTMLRGLSFDFTNTTLVRNSRNQDSVNTAEFAVPILIFLTNDGVVGTYYFVKTDTSAPHPFMKPAQPIPAPSPRPSSSSSIAPPVVPEPVRQPSTSTFPPATDANKPLFTFPSDSKAPAFAPPSAFGTTPSATTAPTASKTPSFSFNTSDSKAPAFSVPSGSSTDSKGPIFAPPSSSGTTPSFTFGTTPPATATIPKPTDTKSVFGPPSTQTETKPTNPTPSVAPSTAPATKSSSFTFGPATSQPEDGKQPATTFSFGTPTDSKTPSFTFPSATPDVLKPQGLPPLPTVPSQPAQPSQQPSLVVVGEDAPRHKISVRKTRDEDQTTVVPLSQTPSTQPQQQPVPPSASFQKPTPSVTAPVISAPTGPSVFKNVISNLDKQAVTGQPAPSAAPIPASTKDIGIQIDSKIDSFNAVLADLRTKRATYMKQMEAIMNGTAAGFNKPTLDKLKEATEALVAQTQNLAKSQLESAKLKDSLYLGFIEVLRQAETIRTLLADKNDAGYKHLLSSRKLDSRSDKLQKQLRGKNQEVNKIMTQLSQHLEQLMIQYKPFLKAQAQSNGHSRASPSTAKASPQPQPPLSVSMSVQPGRSLFQTAQKTPRRNGSAPSSPATPSLLVRKNNSPVAPSNQSAPVLDTIFRTLENHFVIIRNQQTNLDELSKQLDELRLSKPIRRPPRAIPQSPSVPASPMRDVSVPSTPVRPSFGTPSRTPTDKPSPATQAVFDNLTRLRSLLQERSKTNKQVIQPINKIAVTPSAVRSASVSRAPSALSETTKPSIATPPKSMTSTASSPIQFTPAKTQPPAAISTPPLAAFTPPSNNNNNIFNVTKPAPVPADTTFKLADVLASDQEFEIKSKTRSPVSAIPQSSAADRTLRFKANRENATYHKREFESEDNTPTILRQQQPTFPTISQGGFASPVSSKTSASSPLKSVQSRLDLSKLDAEEPEEDEFEEDEDEEGFEDDENDPDYVQDEEEEQEEEEYEEPAKVSKSGSKSSKPQDTKPAFSFGSFGTEPSTTKGTSSSSSAFSFSSGGSGSTPPVFAAPKPTETKLDTTKTFSFGAPATKTEKPEELAASKTEAADGTQKSAFAPPSSGADKKPLFSADAASAFKPKPTTSPTETKTDSKPIFSAPSGTSFSFGTVGSDKDKPTFGSTSAVFGSTSTAASAEAKDSKTEAKAPVFGAPASTTTPSFSFGTPPAASTDKTAATKTDSKSSFSFGSPATDKSADKTASTTEPAKAAETKPTSFSFGSTTSDKPTFGTSTAPAFGFGGATTDKTSTASDKPASTTEPAKPTPATTATDKPTFGAATSTTSTDKSVFGTTPASSTTEPAKTETKPTSFSFGSTTDKPSFGTSPSFGSTSFGSATDKASSSSTGTPSFSFGSPATAKADAPAFGTTATPGSVFGAKPADKPAFGTSSTSATSTPVFGSTPASTTAASAFGATSTPASASTTTPAFGATASTDKPAFGTSTTTAPAFGSTSFGSSSSTTPAFGASTTAPAFGSTSTTSSFGTSSTAPAFGSASSTTSTPAFGSTSFGASTSTPATSTAPSFGSSTTPAFGASTTTAPAFGSSSFGSSTTGSFGSTSTAPAFGASSTSTPAPAFGSTSSTTSAFGSSSSTPAFGTPASTTEQPSFGFGSMGLGGAAPATASKNPFGGSLPSATTTAAPAFGSPSFGAPSTTPLAAPSFGTPSFGTSTPSTSTPAFGATSFAPSASTFTAPTTSAAPAFGTPSATTAPAFGATPAPSFGQPSFGQPSFGQPSFGSTSFGASGTAPSAFGATASPSKVFGATSSTPAASSGFASFASQPATGFGSFGAPSSGAPSFGAAPGSAPSFGSTGNNDLWAPRK